MKHDETLTRSKPRMAIRLVPFFDLASLVMSHIAEIIPCVMCPRRLFKTILVHLKILKSPKYFGLNFFVSFQTPYSYV